MLVKKTQGINRDIGTERPNILVTVGMFFK